MTKEDATKIVQTWLELLARADFDLIALKESDSLKTHSEIDNDLICLSRDIKDINEDDDTILYKNGSKYIGDIEDNVPHGEGQLIHHDGRIFSGQFHHGALTGHVKEVQPQDASIREAVYHNGVMSGSYRHRRFDGQLLGYGHMVSGVKVGPQLVVGSGGNSYFIGEVDNKDKLNGEIIFLYPCLYTAIVGQYKSGKLVSGHYRTLDTATVVNGFISLTFTDQIGREVLYDPPSCFYISRYPLETDQYEDDTVYVAMSSVEGAGEGLFARRDIRCGDLVSLFSGTKIYKDSNKKSVKYGDDEWSDFR